MPFCLKGSRLWLSSWQQFLHFGKKMDDISQKRIVHFCTRLPAEHHERVVPRGDEADNADRLLASHGEVAVGPGEMHDFTNKNIQKYF